MQRRINIAAFVLAATASLSSSLSIQNQKKNNAKTINTFESRRSFVETGAVAAFGIAASTLAQPQQAFAAEASGLPARGAKAPEFELPNSRGSGLVTLDSLVKSSKWTVALGLLQEMKPLLLLPNVVCFNAAAQRCVAATGPLRRPKRLV